MAQKQSTAKPGDPVISNYRCHRHWWTVLPNLPPNEFTRDWWVAAGDTRAARYDRIKRCWFDKTWLKQPKTDPERPHDFYNPRCGTFVLCRTWEMFSLFHPRDWVPSVCRAAGIANPKTPSDCCWSYEFQDKSTGKLVDLTLHVRNDDGSEFLIAGEAKFGDDRLKKLDHLPGTYLDLGSFARWPQRFLIYIVHESYAPEVRQRVRDEQQRNGILTWEEICRLMLKLSEALPGFAHTVVAGWIRLMAKEHTLELSEVVIGSCPSHDHLAAACTELIDSYHDCPPHLRAFAIGLRFHLEARCGRLPVPPFPYIMDEPSCSDVHRIEEGKQSTADRCEELWQLPDDR
ncbi:MAG: hypothetical protein NTX56_03855 [Proteobacteria bacterium]|nr:hypothetical protein [Pseudomonadota bacterium]